MSRSKQYKAYAKRATAEGKVPQDFATWSTGVDNLAKAREARGTSTRTVATPQNTVVQDLLAQVQALQAQIERTLTSPAATPAPTPARNKARTTRKATAPPKAKGERTIERANMRASRLGGARSGIAKIGVDATCVDLARKAMGKVTVLQERAYTSQRGERHEFVLPLVQGQSAMDRLEAAGFAGNGKF